MNIGVTDPDILTGMILGAEGIPDIMVVFNSPTGCKFYHGHISHLKRNESEISDPYLRPEPWFFGQPRIPCTYLDDYDFIFGTEGKLEKILNYVGTTWNGLIVLLNSPGASLIGDNLKKIIERAGLVNRCISVEIPGYSLPACEGVDTILVRILKHIHPSGVASKKVNLLGLSIIQRYCEGTKKELISLLEKSGLSVLSSPGAGADTGTLLASSGAALNILVFPEYAINTALFFQQQYNIPILIPSEGAPVGFDATESWVTEICRLMGTDTAFFTRELTQTKKTAAVHIARLNAISGLPRGMGFAIRAESSIALPLTKWLYNYLGMIPVGIDIPNGSYKPYTSSLQTFLEKNNLSHTLGSFPGKNPDIIFTDGATGSMLQNLGTCRGYIEVSHPPSGKIEVIPRTIFGLTGSLMIVEEILNILR